MKRAQFTAGAFTAAAALACGAAARADVPIRIAAQPIDSAAEPFYADARGFFARSGIQADIQVLHNGGAIVAAVASGAVDCGFANLFSILPAAARGVPISIVAPAALHSVASPNEALIVLKDSPIHSGKDLNGKIVGVLGLRSITHITAEVYIDATGGDSSAVKYLELTDGVMGPALEQGRVDAIATALSDYPDADRPNSPYRILAYPYNYVAPHFLASTWVANKAWADAQPKAVAAFATAIVEAGRWANTNHAASSEILMKVNQLTPEQMAKLSSNRAVYGDVITAALIEPVMRVAVKYGVIDHALSIRDLLASVPRG